MAETSQNAPSIPSVGRLIAANPTDAKTREFVILKPEVTIGSDEANDFVIRDKTVSRCHATITFKQGRLEISDLGSTNGTFVNGQRIQAATLLDKGYKVRFGGAHYVLLKPAAPAGSRNPATTAPGPTKPSPAPKPRRWSRSLRVIAEAILVGFVLGFGTAGYLAYRLYHEQSKILLAEAEAVPVHNLEPNRVLGGPATVGLSAANASAPVSAASATPVMEQASANRATAINSTAPSTAGSVLSSAMALAQLLPGSGRQAGQRAPGFTLPDLQGKSVSLVDFHGKVVLLNFWATWCGACRGELPSLEGMYKNLHNPELAILTINIDQQDASFVQNFVERSSYTFPMLLDRSNQVSAEYGVSGIPAAFLISRDGEILWDCAGGIDWSNPDLRAAIEKLLPLA